MSKILVSFLGKASGGRYHSTVYHHDGAPWGPCKYFALELTKQLQPDRLVIFGTPGSMWDVLLSDHFEDQELTAAQLELMNSAEANTVTEAQLATLQPTIERAVRLAGGPNEGVSVLLKLVGFADDTVGQIAILADLARIVSQGDELILDVTHGFRHLPMIALAGAAYLRHIRGVHIAGLYYGAWEMPGAPVLDLRGLLELLDWVQALAAFKASGDLGVFTAPLQAAGLDANSLREFRQAAFDERNQNTDPAMRALRRVRPHLDRLTSPAAALLMPQLLDRLAWVDGETRSERERVLARSHFVRDRTRAAALLAESSVSRRLETTGGSVANPGVRNSTRKELREEGNADLVNLFNLRNALVHGTPEGKVSQWMSKPETLEQRLRQLEAALRIIADEGGAAALSQGYEA